MKKIFTLLFMVCCAVTASADSYTVTVGDKKSSVTAGEATVTFLSELTTPTDSAYFNFGKRGGIDYDENAGTFTVSESATGYFTVKATHHGSITLNLRHLGNTGTTKYFYIIEGTGMTGMTDFTISTGNSTVKNGGVRFESLSTWSDYSVTFTAESGVTYYISSGINGDTGFRGIEYNELFGAVTKDEDNGTTSWTVTESGSVNGDSLFTTVPGLDFSFGAESGTYSAGYLTDSKGDKRSDNLVLVGDGGVTLTDNVPTAGHFLTLKPYVNGKINVSFYGWNGQQYHIYNADAGEFVYSATPSENADATTGEVVLLAGNTYYMYCTQTKAYGLHVHSLTYEPIYLMLSTYKVENSVATGEDYDTKSLELTLGSEGFEVPKAVTEANDAVVFSVSDSDIKIEDNGTLIIPTTGGNGKITCTVTKGKITQTIYYTLTVKANDNAWMVEKDKEYSVGDKVTSTNGGCTMTFGGWKYNNHKYNDDFNNAGGNMTTDAWGEGRFDDAGNDEYNQPTHTIDGYRYASSGVANGKAESKNVNDANFSLDSDNNHTTYQLACRGAYVVFEPEKNGTLTFYLLQNGCVDTYQKDQTDDDGNVTGKRGMPTGRVSFRTFMIADEEGKFIDDAEGTATATYQYAYADIPTITWGNNGKENSSTIQNILQENITKGGAVKVMKAKESLGGGYYVIRKSYTKYTIKVTAGKSYFVFSNFSKLGICGFQFVADKEENTATDVTLANKTESYKAQTGLSNVTLADRTFTSGRWTTLCLPFSVSTTQLKSVLGDEVQLIEFDKGSLDNSTTANFTNHVYNQMVIAGRPYLVKPATTVTAPTFKNVTVVDGDPTTISGSSAFSFKGVYENETMESGSYYVSGSTGNLSRANTAKDSYSFRAYFSNISGSSDAKISSLSVNDIVTEDVETTAIEHLNIDEDVFGTYNNKVYNLNGQCVGQGNESLAKGVYIQNGKKYVVK